MFCRKCGELIGDTDKFCPACGAPQCQTQASPVLNPQHTHYENCNTQGHAETRTVGFMEAVKLFFINYTNFRGRSRRSEYWWFCLFNLIVSLLLALIIPDFAGLWTLVILVPSLSLFVRRMHDIGKSGWWYFISFVPLVGGILLLIWVCRDSDPHPNQWGPSPKY